MRKCLFISICAAYISLCVAFFFSFTLLNNNNNPRWATTTSGVVIVDVNSFYNKDFESFEIGIEYGTDIETCLTSLPDESWHSEWIEKSGDYRDYQDYTGDIEIAGRYVFENYEATMCYHFIMGRIARQEYLLTFEDVEGDIRKAFDSVFSSLSSTLEGLEYQQESDFSEKSGGNRSIFSSGVVPFSGFSAVWNSNDNENPTYLWLSARDAKANESFVRITIGQQDRVYEVDIP